jgi:hypothetical protein
MTPRKATKIPPPPQWLFLAIAVAFVLLSTSTCHAGWRSRVSQEKMLPPPQFFQYWGDYEIHRIPIDEVTILCKNALKQPGQRAVACSMWRQGKCIIFISNERDLDDAGWDYDIVLRHEMGHCAGWRHDY